MRLLHEPEFALQLARGGREALNSQEKSPLVARRGDRRRIRRGSPLPPPPRATPQAPRGSPHGLSSPPPPGHSHVGRVDSEPSPYDRPSRRSRGEPSLRYSQSAPRGGPGRGVEGSEHRSQSGRGKGYVGVASWAPGGSWGESKALPRLRPLKAVSAWVPCPTSGVARRLHPSRVWKVVVAAPRPLLGLAV